MIQEVEGPTRGWWYAKFRIPWPKNTKPSWHIDLLLAHKILLPILNQYKNDLILWRFHRRANRRDEAGHEFQFIFYSSSGNAQKIYNSLKSDKLLKEMKNVGEIIQDSYDEPNSITKPNVEDTSDPGTPPIRKTWPYFIMGVCQMWLELITEVAKDTPAEQEPSTLQGILEFYQQVNETINQTWQEEGCHHFLHHLNAIFGYEPIMVYPRMVYGALMSF